MQGRAKETCVRVGRLGTFCRGVTYRTVMGHLHAEEVASQGNVVLLPVTGLRGGF